MANRSLGIALGSNLGSKIANLRSAVAGILSFCNEKSILTSSVYETAPVDCPEGSDTFYNAVIQVRSSMEPDEILEKCRKIESKLGRPEKREKNSPRIIDIDLLYYGDKVISEDHLVLPHPGMFERLFVLLPLNEIRPGLILPGQKLSVEEILDSLESDEAIPNPVLAGDSWL